MAEAVPPKAGPAPLIGGLLVLAALCSFAANSILCRFALRDHAIDPASFSAVRISSGAILLTLLSVRKRPWSKGGWKSGGALWLYATAFSFAYLNLSAGTGALLLFGAVQATMFGIGIARSHRPTKFEFLGLAIGFFGLVWLVWPGLASPSLFASLLMVVAGASWGVYSVRGQGQSDPATVTAGNFLWATPLSVAMALVFIGQSHTTPQGIALAALSGAVTSGLGYVAWYAAVPYLSTVRAAVLQLTVPVFTALAGIVFLGEHATVRSMTGTFLVLGGVGMAVLARQTKDS